MWLVVVSIQCDLQWNEAHNVYTNTDNVARDARQAYRKRQASVKFNILLDVLRFRLIRCDRAWENRLQRYHRSAATLCTVHTCVHWCLPCYGTDSFWRIKCFMFFFSCCCCFCCYWYGFVLSRWMCGLCVARLSVYSFDSDSATTGSLSLRWFAFIGRILIHFEYQNSNSVDLVQIVALFWNNTQSPRCVW